MSGKKDFATSFTEAFDGTVSCNKVGASPRLFVAKVVTDEFFYALHYLLLERGGSVIKHSKVFIFCQKFGRGRYPLK